MVTLIFLLSLAGVMLGIGVKHGEPILMAVASMFGLAVAYSYGRFTEAKRTAGFLSKIAKKEKQDGQ